MAINKKAFFFTLLSGVLVVAMIAFFMPNYENYSYMSRVPILKTRFTKADTFVSDIHGKIGERVLVFSSYSALMALNDYINTTKKPLSNITRNFTQAVMNGTINGTNIPDMDNNTIPEMLAELNRLANEQLGLRSNISVLSVNIFQSDETGFDKIGLMMNVSIYVNASIASWNVTKPVYAMIEIERLYDPYYIMNFRYDHKVKFTNITNWTDPSVGVQDVFNLINKTMYTYEPDAPTFLMRFENKTDNSTCCGMESLINPVELKIATINFNVTYVDYCFFNNTRRESCGHPQYGLFNITGITNPTPNNRFYGFKLEITHLEKYNLTAGGKVN